MKMRLSYFGFAKDICDIDRAGYDCIEMHVKEVMGFSDAECRDARKAVRAAGLTAEVFDNPLPLDKVIADPDFDVKYYADYLKKAVDRSAELGARYFVYGNGRTRSIPGYGDHVAAVHKNDDMLATLCSLAAQANITVLVEPLAACISSRFLGVSEIFEYAGRMGIPNLKTLLDYRWFLEGGHDFAVVERYADFIQHVHIDNPLSPFPARTVSSVDDGHNYAPLFAVLKKICYKGIISIEANTTDDFSRDLRRGLDLFAHHGIQPYRS